MKRKLQTISIAVSKKIDYKNGYVCIIHFINNKMDSYHFLKDNIHLSYLNNDEIEEISNLHWSNHHTVLQKQQLLTIEELLNFEKFDKLFYIGGGMDGMVKNITTNKFISTPIKLDEVFFQIYMKLETNIADCEKYLSNLNSKYLISSNIVKIPSYNSNKNFPNNVTLNIIVKIDNDTYNKLLGDKTHIDDYVKIDIVKFISNNTKLIDTYLENITCCDDSDDEEDY
jgi:hypothetical protein